MHGPLKDPGDQRLRDLDGRELACLVPIVILMLFLGLFPGTVLRKMDSSVARYVESLRTQAPVVMTLDGPGQLGPEKTGLMEPER
jgi:NADH-quinone oxidoreductase subunit M